MQEFLDQTFFHNSVQQYLTVAAVLILGLLVIRIFRHYLLKRLCRWADKTETDIDDFIVRGVRKQILPIVHLGLLYIGVNILTLPATLGKIIDVALLALMAIIGTALISSVVLFVFRKYWKKRGTDEANEQVSKWIIILVKILIWSIAIILFLDNIGVQITSLVAGLGVGGVAIAFAAQSILTDIFCFFTILFDRPFENGDFIISGDHMGTVEHIGIKTTRLRALSGEQLVFSNADLTGSRIRNYKSMEQRRIVFTLGVTYDTPYEKLKSIPDMIRGIIESVPDTSFSRSHFSSYGAYSLNFETVYFIMSSDYDLYMNVQQEIYFRIHRAFEENEIEFAFPTQTLHLFGTPDRPSMQ